MNLAYYLAACISALFLLVPSLADEQSKPDGLEKRPSSFSYYLSRRDYPVAERSTFTLDITMKQPNVTAEVHFDLQKGKQGVGKFRLERTDTKRKDQVRYRISCLHDDFITDSRLHITIRDDATGESIEGVVLPLRNAENNEPVK